MSSATDALIGHHEVVKAVGIVLQKGRVPSRELEDVTQAVLVAAWAWTEKGRPETMEGWRTVCCAIADKVAISELRKLLRRGRYNVGPIGDGDVGVPGRHEAPEGLDLKRAVEQLRDLHAAGQLPRDVAAIVAGLVDGLTQSEIADELGVGHGYVRQQTQMFRAAYHRRLALNGLAAVLVVFVGSVSTMRFVPAADFAHIFHPAPARREPNPLAPSGDAPAPSAAAPDASMAREGLLAAANDAATHHDWSTCLGLLRKLDPDAGLPADAAKLMKACEQNAAIQEHLVKVPPH